MSIKFLCILLISPIFGDNIECDCCHFLFNFLSIKLNHSMNILNKNTDCNNKLDIFIKKHEKFKKDLNANNSDNSLIKDLIRLSDMALSELIILDFMLKNKVKNFMIIYCIYIFTVLEINKMLHNDSYKLCTQCQILRSFIEIIWNLFLSSIRNNIINYTYIEDLIDNIITNINMYYKEYSYMQNLPQSINCQPCRYCFLEKNFVELKEFFLVLEKIEGQQARFEKKQPSFSLNS